MYGNQTIRNTCLETRKKVMGHKLRLRSIRETSGVIKASEKVFRVIKWGWDPKEQAQEKLNENIKKKTEEYGKKNMGNKLRK